MHFHLVTWSELLQPWRVLVMVLLLLAILWALRNLITTQRDISYLEKAKSLDWSWPKDPQVTVFFIQTCEQEIKKLHGRRNSKKYAKLQSGMGFGYFRLLIGDRTANLERAISCYQEALRFQTPETDPLGYAAVQNNLGLVYDRLPTGDRTANLERAISCYQEALHFWLPETAPHLYALVQDNLGKAYDALPTGDQTANLERAISYCQEALRFLTPETDPFHYCRTTRRLGDIYFTQQEWQAALNVYQAAMLVDERLYQTGLSTESKAAEIAENAAIYPHAAYAAFRCGRIPEALLILERGKTRVLAEALRLRIARPTNIPDEVWNAFESAAVVRRAQFEDTALPDDGHNLVQAYAAYEQKVQAANAALDTAIKHIRLLAPNFLQTMHLSDIDALLPDEHTVLVTFSITDQGSVGFVVSSNQEVQAIEIPTFTQARLINLLVELDANDDVSGGWLGAYIEFLYEQTPTTFDTWQTTISKTLVEIGQDLLAPIVSSLPLEVKQIIFLPSDKLFLLPLHAAPLSGDGSDPICDHYQISYAPSIEVLVNIRAKATNEVIPELYAVINPEADPRLIFSLTEGTSIANLFEKNTVDQGEAGTKQHVIEGMRERSYIHFSCHGSYNWSDPPNSSLALADGKLTLQELQQGTIDLSVARLVTLSACETGMIDITEGRREEYVGIPAGFLLAGVPCVISSLWSVQDLSTALIMERFYRNHLTSRMDFAEALREAQIWARELSIREVVAHIEQCYKQAKPEERAGFLRYLRYYRHQAEDDPTLRPFAHPYYWAAFTVNGM